jgi:hypothetical protein
MHVKLSAMNGIFFGNAIKMREIVEGLCYLEGGPIQKHAGNKNWNHWVDLVCIEPTGRIDC